MEIILQRLWHDKEQTFGFARDLEGLFKAHSLEDEPRDQKVKGETRIPAGRYELKIRKEDTPLTLRHRESYNKAYKTAWFQYHIEVVGVKTHSGIYIHSGVDQAHTDGCLLFADKCDLSLSVKPLANSLVAIKRFYELVYPKLESGERCFITILDENNIISLHV